MGWQPSNSKKPPPAPPSSCGTTTTTTTTVTVTTTTDHAWRRHRLLTAQRAIACHPPQVPAFQWLGSGAHDGLDADIISKRPKLTALIEKLLTEPKVKAYYDAIAAR